MGRKESNQTKKTESWMQGTCEDRMTDVWGRRFWGVLIVLRTSGNAQLLGSLTLQTTENNNNNNNNSVNSEGLTEKNLFIGDLF